MTAKNACDNAEPKTSVDLMSRDLDANKQEKSLENKDDKNLSPSMLDSSERCNLYNIAVKPATSPKFEEIVYNQPRQLNTNKILRSALRTKLIEDKSEIIDKQKASENVENKLTKEKTRHIYMRLFAFWRLNYVTRQFSNLFELIWSRYTSLSSDLRSRS